MNYNYGNESVLKTVEWEDLRVEQKTTGGFTAAAEPGPAPKKAEVPEQTPTSQLLIDLTEDLIDLSNNDQGSAAPTGLPHYLLAGNWNKAISPERDEGEAPAPPKVLMSATEPHPPKPKATIRDPKSLELLPTSTAPGYIPVNASGERLEIIIPRPPQMEFDEYKQRVKKSKLCKNYHLLNFCDSEKCGFDHSPIKPTVQKAFTWHMQKIPCRKGSACRDERCVHGHMCLVPGCRGKSQGGCRFNGQRHEVDMEVVAWVDAQKD